MYFIGNLCIGTEHLKLINALINALPCLKDELNFFAAILVHTNS